jgi:hypothetical protein
MSDEQSEFLTAMAEVDRRVAAGRADGRYSPDLDDQLASEFTRLGKDPLWFAAIDAVDAVVARLGLIRFGQSLIDRSSSMPGGSAIHAAVAKIVSRQTHGLAEQAQVLATQTYEALTSVQAALDEIRVVIRGDVFGDIDAVHHRLIAVERRLAALEAKTSPGAQS